MSNSQQGANETPKTPAQGISQHQNQNPGSPKPADKQPNQRQK